jgi:two-component sensor histidine kinase
MAARADPSSAKFAEGIVERIGSLNRAHGIVLKSSNRAPDTLLELIGRLIAPYNASTASVITVTGDEVEVGQSASTAIALVLHELATNAVKYGSLSVPAGTVEVKIQALGDNVHLRWAEFGGPVVAGEPQKRGFGSLLVDRAVKSQLGARMHFAWLPSGLVVEIEMAKSKLRS